MFPELPVLFLMPQAVTNTIVRLRVTECRHGFLF
jgi:hypothetical protein